MAFSDSAEDDQDSFETFKEFSLFFSAEASKEAQRFAKPLWDDGLRSCRSIATVPLATLSAKYGPEVRYCRSFCASNTSKLLSFSDIVTHALCQPTAFYNDYFSKQQQVPRKVFDEGHQKIAQSVVKQKLCCHVGNLGNATELILCLCNLETCCNM